MSKYHRYWEENIERWAELYLDISHGHEKLETYPWLARLYNSTIARYEAKLMQQRYGMTLEFIDANVSKACRFADIGCGTGIFAVEALRRGAAVLAIDFSKQALAVTQKNVERNFPSPDIEYFELDITSADLPASKVAIMVGVAPYLPDLENFLVRVLASTDALLIQYVDPYHWANRLRRLLPFLNVRRLAFHRRDAVTAVYVQQGWSLERRENLGSGFVDTVRRKAI